MTENGTNRALRLLAEHGPMTAHQFLEEMWPDSVEGPSPLETP